MPRRNRLSFSDNAQATITLPTDAIGEPGTLRDGQPLPKMVVFDLDYTLWPMWVDTHVYGPLKGSRDGGLTVKDAYGASYGFYGDVAGVLTALKSKGIAVGAASRTSAPELARVMLQHLRIPPPDSDASSSAAAIEGGGTERASVRAIDVFDYLEIYPGSKTTHFQRLHKKSGLPYSEMLFFDDESRNRNVEQLGVVMQLVRDGVTSKELDEGVKAWRRRNDRTRKEG